MKIKNPCGEITAKSYEIARHTLLYDAMLTEKEIGYFNKKLDVFYEEKGTYEKIKVSRSSFLPSKEFSKTEIMEKTIRARIEEGIDYSFLIEVADQVNEPTEIYH